MEFFRIRRDIPFMRHALVLNIVSFLTFAAAVFFLATRGLHLEFTGGTVMEVEYAQAADIGKTRGTVESLGFGEVQVQKFGTSRDVLIRLPLRGGDKQDEVAARVFGELWELAIVMGQRARWITPAEAPTHILGYTAANDVSARDLQRSDGQWTRAKGFDTFCPLGPWIDTRLDPSDALVTCHVNGQLRQMASTRDMVFPVAQLVAYISSVMTLEPGDVILTGTPSGVGPLEPGDEVRVEVEGLCTLTNPVRNDPHRESPTL